MPVVLRVNGYALAVLAPPREHGPPHVHVRRGGGHAVILLPSSGGTALLRSSQGLNRRELVGAVRLVEEHAKLLFTEWRRIHGTSPDLG